MPRSRRRVLALAAAFAALTLAPTAAAAKDTFTIPLQIGLGPSFYFITGPLQDDQVPYWGLKIYARAIIDGEALKKAKKKVPKKYRKYIARSEELRIGHLLVPDALIISPQTEHTAIYGATWRPLALDLPLGRSPRLTVGAGLLLTYAFIHTELSDEEQLAQPDLTPGTTHFLRPGADLRAELEFKLSEQWLVSVGWSSGFYIPQELGGDIFAVGEVDRGVWHMGQAYLQLHYRIPYTTAF